MASAGYLMLATVIATAAIGIGGYLIVKRIEKAMNSNQLSCMIRMSAHADTGVPLGTFIGQHFGWRETFLAVSALGVIAFIGSLMYVPKNIQHNKPASVLQDLAGFSAGSVSLVLLVYGVSVAFGNIWGGKLADKRGPISALKIMFLLLAAVLFMLTFTAHNQLLALLTVLLWGAVAFGNVPGLQVYVVRQAEHHTPHSVDVASGLNIAAFNLGIAGGAWGGGLIVAHLGLVHTAWIGGLVVLAAYALTVWSGHLDRKTPLPEPSGDSATLVAGH